MSPQLCICTTFMELTRSGLCFSSVCYNLEDSWGLWLSFMYLYWIKLYCSYIFCNKQDFQIPVNPILLTKSYSHGTRHLSASQHRLLHRTGFPDSGVCSLATGTGPVEVFLVRAHCCHCHQHAKPRRTTREGCLGISWEEDSSFNWLMCRGWLKWPENDLVLLSLPDAWFS